MLDGTKKALDKFGERVVIDSKKNLRKRNKVASGRLINSVNYEAEVTKDGFEIFFEMEDYGIFTDAGVHGIGGTKADGTKWKKKRVVDSKFRYKKSGGKNSNGRFLQSLNGWTIKRSIAPRDDSGKFIKRRSLLFAIRTSIIHTGIETTKFFTKPLNDEFKKLPDVLLEAIGLDVEEDLKLILQ